MSGFGILLAELRRSRHLSQVALAELAGLSQRHISFLESGRARPGSRALSRLVDALALGQPEASRLLAAAGVRASRAPVAWNDPAMAEARGVIGRLLERHEPYPGVVCDRGGEVLLTGASFDGLLAAADPGSDLWSATCTSRPRNLYDLTLHPAGIVRLLLNPEAVVPHVVRRLRLAAAVHEGASCTLERVSAYPATRSFRGLAGTEVSSAVVTEDYRLGAEVVRLISTLCCFGAPEDETAQDILIEMFFPADPATDRLLRRVTTDAAGGCGHQPNLSR
jgi:transcriptional regulator with XRE-family HTH domain